ncbi:MAG: hypothetical protein R3F60_28950 [bacterium]
MDADDEVAHVQALAVQADGLPDPSDQPVDAGVFMQVAPERASRGEVPPRPLTPESLRSYLSRGASLAVVRVAGVEKRMEIRVIDGLSYHFPRGLARLDIERVVAGRRLPRQLDVEFADVQYGVDLVAGERYLLPIGATRWGRPEIPRRHGDLPTAALRLEADQIPSAAVTVDALLATLGGQ